MALVKISLNGEANGDMTNKPQPASDIPDSWPDANRLTGKLPFDANQSETADDMFNVDKAVEGDADLRNGNTKPGAEGKASRPDENFRAGGRTTNEVESTHCDMAAKGSPASYGTLADIFGDVFGDIFGDRRVRSAIRQAEDNANMQSLSKGKSKSAKMRSQMLKLIMPELSRDQGDRLASAIDNHDGETVKKIMTQIGIKLGNQISRKK